MFEFDQKLRANAPFKRCLSFSAAGINLQARDFEPAANITASINEYTEKIRRLMIAKFKQPSLSRSEYGQLINVDEALDGITECYRHTRKTRSLLRIGINLSASYGTDPEIAALRAGATIAVYQLAMSRGQSVQLDVCYGNFSDWRDRSKLNQIAYPLCHVRISVAQPTVASIARISTIAMRNAVGNVVINGALGIEWGGGYQFHYLATKGLAGEFDFVLDRIETPNLEAEYERIEKQIENLK